LCFGDTIIVHSTTGTTLDGTKKQDGTREGEKQLFNFRKKRRATYSGFIETLDSFKTENEEQKQQVAKWSKLFNERLARIETEWEHRKN
jgi:hypothetical protein